MSESRTPTPASMSAPDGRFPDWVWGTFGALGTVGVWWSVDQAAAEHPQGLAGALIPPGFAVLVYLAGWLLHRQPTPAFAGLRWQLVVWGTLGFCLLQVANGAWERTGSWAVVLLASSVTLTMVPALGLVSRTLRLLPPYRQS
ncbi:hypothetical protein ABZ234_08380 [Nocardiopsis sp. NPDC006198]|uniref:hypothetical protein n=1 Tax=Nocardiopsis sp. NPDC006198 TaxID=3154472 RepID=UPI0033B95668